ncbi:antiviral RADAR system adenosine triphosphatase RdrA [Chromobacterium haemolyticum]|uniref:antiviral RADAR system adenosine triphosphatase RdrA n=1 Tax=Chromobacterium haemolyticum TaxID=394935 RepID=UPI0024484F09|nr:antiviral RADAR system adenosine triphosphatase RdrA [Chromobacterium haemolyticum]MDH0344090.1 KAP family NTPase [Chromobacterium haemolyticum]
MSQNKRYIPLNAGESAVLPDANTLLPRDEVYEPLAQMIIDAVKKAEAAKNKTLNELREHNAISIDGARGTGKTAVLVNLKNYLKDRDVLKDVHILGPVDPTLLEDGDSLFLHIIVAAVLHDKDVKAAQKNDPSKARSLNQMLEKLAQSLESVETQKDRHGMDKVRAMYSNKQLADCVQDFFRNVLELLGKKLLVLPIDDVDTALNRAFENLEIVRRYLATPYVLPIVCGDRSLYDEVTWRDFHGRLTEDSNYCREEAYERAVELATEYQRKILPFPRRLTMPEVSSYWQQSDIYLRDGQSELMSLRNFIAWLEIFLTGPVNGLEGSRLLLPIPSIRALSQLVKHFSGFISELPVAVRESKGELEARYNWQMPSVPLDKAARHKRNEFAQNLANYFCFEPKAGAAYLVLLAKLHWKNWSEAHPSARQRSLLDTPLFQPLEHAMASFELFDKVDDLSIWPALLAERLPEEWLAGIKSQKTILPYPVAEIGVNSSKEWGYAKKIQQLEINGLDDGKKNKASFLIALLVQHNFYTNAKQTMLLNVGRVFELLIASIVGVLSVEDVHAILGRAPFFSAAALAPTKTILIDANAGEDDVSDADFEEGHDSSELILELCKEINAWRAAHNVDQIDLSPWLVYKVFNKVYSQVASSEKVPKGMRDAGRALNMVAHTFYATWFAFGSFEKGELFELPNVIATTNINPEKLKNYKSNDQFNVNVKPFLDASKDGKSVHAVSYVMAEHPLKKWVDGLIELEWSIADNKKSGVGAVLGRDLNKKMPKTASEWFKLKFNLDPAKRLTDNLIETALKRCSESEARDAIEVMQNSYNGSRDISTIANVRYQFKKKFPEIK